MVLLQICIPNYDFNQFFCPSELGRNLTREQGENTAIIFFILQNDKYTVNENPAK